MARTVKESEIKTRAKRDSLDPGLHWRGIDPKVHLGYRKRARSGEWLVRWYVGNQKYKQATIGTADDVIATGNMDFDAAVRAAREHVTNVRQNAAREAAGPVLTVRAAIEKYQVLRDATTAEQSGREKAKSSAHRLNSHVIKNHPELADTPVHELTDAALAAWRISVPGTVATKNRIRNDFRAALNSATTDRHIRAVISAGLASPDKKGNGTARPNQFLGDETVKAIVAAAAALNDDFGRLVLVLAYTGARFAQVRRMTVADVMTDRLMVPSSFKGRVGADKRPPAAVPVPAAVIEALQPAVAGRSTDAPLLEHWRHRQTAPMKWERVCRGPWNTPSEMTRNWKKAVEAAGLPDGTIPYALRHSSIIRGLRAGLPVSLVAQNHNTSAIIIKDHYGAHITDSMFDMAARAMMIP